MLFIHSSYTYAYIHNNIHILYVLTYIPNLLLSFLDFLYFTYLQLASFLFSVSSLILCFFVLIFFVVYSLCFLPWLCVFLVSSLIPWFLDSIVCIPACSISWFLFLLQRMDPVKHLTLLLVIYTFTQLTFLYLPFL